MNYKLFFFGGSSEPFFCVQSYEYIHDVLFVKKKKKKLHQRMSAEQILPI